jgi:hypothetical protein
MHFLDGFSIRKASCLEKRIVLKRKCSLETRKEAQIISVLARLIRLALVSDTYQWLISNFSIYFSILNEMMHLRAFV